MEKRSKKYQSKRKFAIASAALICLLTVTIGSTLAWLADESDTLVNTLEPQQVTVVVREDFDNVTKSNVRIENTSEVPVYIRVALIPNWMNENRIIGISATLDDLLIDWGSGNWVASEDGYYYYTKSVVNDASTDVLIDSAVVKTINKYQMNLQIIAQAIQALPDEAVEEAWSNDKVTVDANNGTLTVTPTVQP